MPSVATDLSSSLWTALERNSEGLGRRRGSANGVPQQHSSCRDPPHTEKSPAKSHTPAWFLALLACRRRGATISPRRLP